MREVAKTESKGFVGKVREYSEQLISTLRNSLYPGAKDESIVMVVDYCREAKLDVMLKPVHIVPMWIVDKNTGQGAMRDIVMHGINFYRIQASRSGCAGISEPEYGEDVRECLGGVDIVYPKWCKMTVKRIIAGTVVEFTAIEYWKENYATAGKDKQTGKISDAPNAMWKKRPYAQLAKCTEAQALRKAFPEIGAMPTAEEMEGKQFDSDELEEIQKQKPVAGKGVHGLKSKLGMVKEAEPTEFDEETGEVIDAEAEEVETVEAEAQAPADDHGTTYETIEFLMESATTPKELMDAMKMAKDMSPADKKKVSALFNKRQAEIRN